MQFERLPQKLEIMLKLFEFDNLSAELITYDLRKVESEINLLTVGEVVSKLFILGYIERIDKFIDKPNDSIELEEKFKISLKGQQYLIQLNDYEFQIEALKKNIEISEKANKIAEQSNKKATISNLIALVSLIVSLIVFFKDYFK